MGVDMDMDCFFFLDHANTRRQFFFFVLLLFIFLMHAKRHTHLLFLSFSLFIATPPLSRLVLCDLVPTPSLGLYRYSNTTSSARAHTHTQQRKLHTRCCQLRKRHRCREGGYTGHSSSQHSLSRVLILPPYPDIGRTLPNPLPSSTSPFSVPCASTSILCSRRCRRRRRPPR